MLLILVRHAHANSAAPGEDDASRSLSEAGEREAAAVAERLREALEDLGSTPPGILASPKRRAMETARILARVLGTAEPAEHAALASSNDPARLFAALPAPPNPAARGRQPAILLVGHEPDMGRALAYLLDPTWHGAIPLRTAGFAIVETEAVPPNRPGRLRRFGDAGNGAFASG
ncbi:MAG: histidine phosphatase family protein [Candidatus Eisenbacteria bacterium]